MSVSSKRQWHWINSFSSEFMVLLLVYHISFKKWQFLTSVFYHFPKNMTDSGISFFFIFIVYDLFFILIQYNFPHELNYSMLVHFISFYIIVFGVSNFHLPCIWWFFMLVYWHFLKKKKMAIFLFLFFPLNRNYVALDAGISSNACQPVRITPW